LCFFFFVDIFLVRVLRILTVLLYLKVLLSLFLHKKNILI
jgi:hypothetical protein